MQQIKILKCSIWSLKQLSTKDSKNQIESKQKIYKKILRVQHQHADHR